MLLELEDYVDRAPGLDPRPGNLFVPITESEEQLGDAVLSPAAAIPAALNTEIVRARAASMLHMQQFLIYRVGANLGVLQAALPAVRDAMQVIVPLVATEIEAIIADATATAAGIAADALGSIPIVGLCVKAAAAGVELGLALDRAMNTPGTMIGLSLPFAQTYHAQTDIDLANQRVLAQAETRDWTSLFMPSMRGELHAEIRKNQGGNIVIAWGLKEGGKVPRVIIDDKPLFKPYSWHFSENGGRAAAGELAFTSTGGLGAVPGTTQIIDVTQSAFREPQNLHRGHETLGDPRCGSDRKTSDVNVGSWYPSTANGAWSLFGYCTKASAASYTIATQEVVDAWQAYGDALWEGIAMLWRNEAWESGYGCGAWQNALQGLVAAHCVGTDGLVGGFGAWMPTRYQTKLTSADRNAWEKNNLVTRIVKPAMMDLREMQLALLRKTPMAAYLPSHGLGSMRDVSVKQAFDEARVRILKHPFRNTRLARTDVVDDWYRDQIVARNIGSDTAEGGISSSDYKPPRVAMPGGGGGRGTAVLIGGGVLAAVAVGLAIRARRR